jgi:hypothetical protein
MQLFTGYEYLLIDAGNHFGLDKENFENRIQYMETYIDDLESLTDQADEPELYAKAVAAIRRAQAGEAIGHMVGFDSVCSGMQIMSAITGCEAGADATGLIDPNRRADAYTDCTGIMRRFIPGLPDSKRDNVKNAVMTSLYGSMAEPKKEFGDGTAELNAFYKAMYILAPGAVELLDDLLKSWKPYALAHQWTLPDGFVANVKVIAEVEKRIDLDELGGASFTYHYRENAGCEYDRKNAANVVHSIDAYVLRSLIRRCNYDREQAEWAYNYIEMMLSERHMGVSHQVDTFWLNEDFQRLQQRYNETGMPDIRILDYVQKFEMRAMSTQHLKQLKRILNQMLEHKPFPIIAVHDEFKCHPNHMNYLRAHYIEIMAGLAESVILDDILNTLYETTGGTFPKKSKDLASKIRKSNYAIC